VNDLLTVFLGKHHGDLDVASTISAVRLE